MEEQTPIEEVIDGIINEGMRPMIGHNMLNFFNWLANQHPEVKELSNLPQHNLLQLVDEFEDRQVNGDDKQVNGDNNSSKKP